MTEAKKGDTVRVHYTGKLTDGTQFDSSHGREPIEFELGSGQVIQGFERQVEGMAVGDTATVTVAAQEAYGDHDPQRVQKVPRSQVPPEVPLDVGSKLQASTQSGQTIQVQVVDVDEQAVTIDANHPLAGKDLVFDLELVEIK